MRTTPLRDVIDATRPDRHEAKWSYSSRVSVPHRYVAVAVAKVACSTLKLALHRFETPEIELDDWTQVHDAWPGNEILDYSTDEVMDMLTSPDWLRFCFVRNPYDRLLSCWKSKLAPGGDAAYHHLRGRIRDAFDYPVVDGERVGTVAFRDSVEYLLAPNERLSFDDHWTPQSEVLRPDLIAYDVVGRFETFTADLRSILRRLGAPENVVDTADEVINATGKIPLAAAYDANLARRVHTHYEEDFERFGYDAESWRLG